MDERGFWDEYRRAYELCLSETSTDDAPWFDHSRRRQAFRAD